MVRMPSPFQPTDIPSSSTTTTPGPILIDGSEQDSVLSNSDLLTRPELIIRRLRRTRQLARIYREHYWALMEEIKLKYREYYWEFGKSPFADDGQGEETNNNNNNNNRCGVHGCKAKAMALTRFCHMHILSDAKQKLYKPCNFSIKSSTTGPILCGKPILKSTVPSYCPLHFQKAEKHMARALKKAGMNASSTSRSAPKFHIIAGEYVRRIKNNRKAAAQLANLETGVVKKNNS